MQLCRSDWDPPAPGDGGHGYRYLVSLIRALPESYRRVLELKCVEEGEQPGDRPAAGAEGSMSVATRVLRGRTMLAAALEKGGGTSMDERMLRHAPDGGQPGAVPGRVGRGGRKPDWSHRYLRNRTRLLADPFGWAKRMARPVWKRAARTAARVLLACLVTLGALMAVPAVARRCWGWFHQVQDDLVTFINPKRTMSRGPPGGCGALGGGLFKDGLSPGSRRRER